MPAERVARDNLGNIRSAADPRPSRALRGNLDLWSTSGSSNYGHYSNPQVDRDLAGAVDDFDQTQQAADFNAADVLMTKDAYVLPLYHRPILLALSNQFVNIRNNPTRDGPAYNMAEWGLRMTA